MESNGSLPYYQDNDLSHQWAYFETAISSGPCTRIQLGPNVVKHGPCVFFSSSAITGRQLGLSTATLEMSLMRQKRH